jgi:hypothetical protein
MTLRGFCEDVREVCEILEPSKDVVYIVDKIPIINYISFTTAWFCELGRTQFGV